MSNFSRTSRLAGCESRGGRIRTDETSRPQSGRSTRLSYTPVATSDSTAAVPDASDDDERARAVDALDTLSPMSAVADGPERSRSALPCARGRLQEPEELRHRLDHLVP